VLRKRVSVIDEVLTDLRDDARWASVVEGGETLHRFVEARYVKFG
jgi:hypothetical protein